MSGRWGKHSGENDSLQGVYEMGPDMDTDARLTRVQHKHTQRKDKTEIK